MRAWTAPAMAVNVALTVLITAGGGCASAGNWTDFTSVSVGNTSGGRVHHPAKMSRRGRGWVVPKQWRERNNQYGVTELVAAIEHAATRVRARHRRSVLAVADLSPKRGGKSIWHHSHQSGRDVDLIFYSVDDDRTPMAPPQDEMVHYDATGKPFVPKHMERTGYAQADWESRRFDVARNWALVEALLTDPDVRVQWIFVSHGLEDLLLRHASRKKRPKWVREYARRVMNQPGSAAPHDDHFHVRIYCPRGDRALGCQDTGPVWHHEKKTFKYGGPERYDPVLWRSMVVLPLFFPAG